MSKEEKKVNRRDFLFTASYTVGAEAAAKDGDPAKKDDKAKEGSAEKKSTDKKPEEKKPAEKK